MTAEQLHQIMPALPRADAQRYIEPMVAAMVRYEITGPRRAAAFAAQVAHESGQLKFWHELASGHEYEGRIDLGNTHPGDGALYKGRGPLQVTGRANYAHAGKALGLDLIDHPDLLLQPGPGFLAAGLYWSEHGLNPLADMGTDGAFTEITRKINGGLNGLASRLAFYHHARAVLGA
jgi:predicted chitinase